MVACVAKVRTHDSLTQFEDQPSESVGYENSLSAARRPQLMYQDCIKDDEIAALKKEAQDLKMKNEKLTMENETLTIDKEKVLAELILTKQQYSSRGDQLQSHKMYIDALHQIS